MRLARKVGRFLPAAETDNPYVYCNLRGYPLMMTRRALVHRVCGIPERPVITCEGLLHEFP